MDRLVFALHALVPPAWTAATAAYLLVFLGHAEGAERWARRLAVLAAVLHVCTLGVVAAAGLPPLASAAGLISGTALATAMVYLVVERRIRSRAIGVFPMGIVALLATAATAAGDPLEPVAEGLKNWSTAAHVATAIMAYCALLISALFGTLYLVQRSALRNRRFGIFWDRLPSLELLDDFSHRSLAVSFALLTATIGMGHVTRSVAGLSLLYSDPKVWVTNGIWLLMGVIVVGRWLDRLRPRFSALSAIGLFAAAVGNLVIVNAISSHGGF